MKRRALGIPPLPWFGLGRNEEVGRRGRAAAATTALGDGVARPERRGTGAAWLVVVDGREECLFIDVARRWGEEAPVVVAGEHRGAP